jgi:TonB family protein
MNLFRCFATALLCGGPVFLHAQNGTPPKGRPVVPEPVRPLPDPDPLYWPGGLPPYEGPIPPEQPPMEDTSPAPVIQDSIRSVVDTAPCFPGGEVALRAYLQKNVVYPELALEIGSEGEVRVAFVVWPDGHLTDVRVPEGEPHPELHQEAVRLVKRMPNWIPASVNGSMVAAHASVWVTFRIRD